MTSSSSETPLMKQYNEVKGRYPDSLLFFRMGDFYELFYEDAKTASKALEIALTARNKTTADPVPMCGVPHHASSGYIHRLVQQGFKVAICEQLEDPATAKGIVKRDVTRVVSPGTRFDPETLDSKTPNFTHAAYAYSSPSGKELIAWATCDFSTGKFWFGTSTSRESWTSYILSQSISEVLFPESKPGEEIFDFWHQNHSEIFAQTVPAFYFNEAYARERIQEQFQALHLSAVHPSLDEACLVCIPAIGALIKYFQETQKALRIPSCLQLEHWGLNGKMELDCTVVQALELLPQGKTTRDISLWSLLDRTKTAVGGRMLREWILSPLTNRILIEQRHASVEEALKSDLEGLRSHLSEIYDFERLLSRIALGGVTSANGRDLRALAYSIVKTSDVAFTLQTVPSLLERLSPYLHEELFKVSHETLLALAESLPISVKEGGIFRKGHTAELDELIELCENGESWLTSFEARERERTGINSLKVKFNRVFGYYIEITKANLKLVPQDYIRKQTMVGGERFITEELKNFEDRILTAEKKRHDLEFQIFKNFCARFSALADPILKLSRAVAHIDVIAGFALLAREEGWVRPTLEDSLELEIIEGTHPTVSRALKLQSSGFVPNSVKFDSAHWFHLITGPNMGGKSTVMRQTALIVLLAQMGSFVPAKSARIGIVDRVFTRIGASDNIAEGASTFMVEMSEMSFILRHATDRSLILLDEIGRGTSTYDGMSLAWALASDISQRVRARTLFATHYHELTQLQKKLPGIKNLRVAVSVQEKGPQGHPSVNFLYKLEEGASERSYGILVARLAGLPQNVLKEAEEILAELENQVQNLPASNEQLMLKF